jgi:ribosomal-protein-alanine N-acetyltransferase
MMIRVVEASDLLEVLQIEYAVFKFPYPPDLVNFLYANYRETFLVADIGGIKGFLIAIYDEEEGHILSIAVKDDCRDLGIGKALMGYIMSFLREQAVPLVRLEVRKGNARAISFYESMGFRRTEHLPDYYEDGEAAYVMIKYIR